MSWTLLFGVATLLGLALFAAFSRRAELSRMALRIRQRDRAERHGPALGRLHHPVVDLSRCLGCGACVAACPEDQVLDLVHGQAAVVNPDRCQGISACERVCPVDAITVTIHNLETRRDIPAIEENLEVIGSEGLFLAGEITAHALIKTAIDHGTAVAAEVAKRCGNRQSQDDVLDLAIVGAGPGGLACSLEAKRRGLRFVTLEQADTIGGTVARYPRRKLVLTEPMNLPLHGRVRETSFTKEELIELWHRIVAEHDLPIETGQLFEHVERDAQGHYVVHTASGTWLARHVCLAVGRRGTPRQLGVPGEHLPHVAYSLLDAHSYQNRRILVVGGGDTAVEAALALAEQPGNRVAVSYRRDSFLRIRSRNEKRLSEAREQGRIRTVLQSQVTAIHPDHVEVVVRDQHRKVPIDDVFVMVGGVAPVALLERCGVSFDATRRRPAKPVTERGTGLLAGLRAAFVLAVVALAFALWHADYYFLPTALRPTHAKHEMLRPGMGVGLGLGIVAIVLIVGNLLYVVRRSPRWGLRLGSLRLWMTSHVATGILALLCAMLHGAMDPRDTPGGHALWGLFALIVTGAIGRYFYAYVPRAANGRELELTEVKAQLEGVALSWGDEHRRLGERVSGEITQLCETRQWKSSLPGRILALLGVQRDLRRVLTRVAADGQREGLAPEQIHETLRLTRRAGRAALMAAHFEDLRTLLASWRYVHRWVAALMVGLVAVHVFCALAYGLQLPGGRAP